ncbi:MAG: N-acetylmuramoyl-L-alanine amidase [Pseudomonadota bacterium]
MMRQIGTAWLWAALVWMACTLCATAQGSTFSGLARVDVAASGAKGEGRSGLRLDLHLSQGVPYRLFTLDEPMRLVLDFQEVDWTGVEPMAFVVDPLVASTRVGAYRPGLSRMVMVLDQPLAVDTAGLAVDPTTGAAHLSVTLASSDPDTFAKGAGAPFDTRWDLPDPAPLPALPDKSEGRLRVVLDPGHGGIDPGAERGVLNEKTLMLTFARELQDILLRSEGYDVVLTRDADYFVSLDERISVAHAAQADVFLSLHADSLSEGLAHGATVYVLSQEASDLASAKLAERHDRDDLLAGLDLSGTDDEVTRILLGLARMETRPRTTALAHALVDGMAQTGGPMNRRPLRSAAFSVLKAADIPSVLIEIGFLSSPRDLKNLQDATWRRKMAEGIRNGLNAWQADDAASRPLVRQ